MAQVVPQKTTAGDLCTLALRAALIVGQGQSPTQGQVTEAWELLQMLLLQWQRDRWKVYHLIEYITVSTGAQTYTIGPQGNFSVDFSSDFNNTAQIIQANRPDKIEAAFVRMNASSNNPVDVPLEIIESFEEYSRVPLKSLVSFPERLFYDPAWPTGVLYFHPVPNATIYSLGIVVKEQLPLAFTTLNTPIALPYEYFRAIWSNLALELRTLNGILAPPGDLLEKVAMGAREILQEANTAIDTLQMPTGLRRGGKGYNIFSDQITN